MRSYDSKEKNEPAGIGILTVLAKRKYKKDIDLYYDDELKILKTENFN